MQSHSSAYDLFADAALVFKGGRCFVSSPCVALRAPHRLARLQNACHIGVLSRFTRMPALGYAGKKLQVAISERNIVTNLKQS